MLTHSGSLTPTLCPLGHHGFTSFLAEVGLKDTPEGKGAVKATSSARAELSYFLFPSSHCCEISLLGRERKCSLEKRDKSMSPDRSPERRSERRARRAEEDAVITGKISEKRGT